MRRLLVIALISFPIFLSANFTGDSTRYLSPKDTIFLSLGAFQEKIFEHYMAPKQTLFSLAKFYGLSLEEIYFYNPEYEEGVVPLHAAVKIPIPNKAIKRYKTKGFDPQKHALICYKIKKGDTVYNISKRIMEMPIDSVMVRNSLMSFDLSPGQILQVGWISTDGIPESFRKFRGHPLMKKNFELRNEYVRERQIKNEYLERGVAAWQKDKNDNKDLYALHRKAPINSKIAINNPMNNRTVYAKVIGRIPATLYPNNVLVVISPQTAKLLGAKDPRFYVKLRYLRK